MAVGGCSEFDVWLSERLLAYNTDESVFGTYIKGILEGEESLDEKKEALESILTDITEEGVTKFCQEILDKWKLVYDEESNAALDAVEDVDVKLSRLMSQAQATTVRNSNYTDEERRIREAILSQYGQCSDDEEEAEVTNTKVSSEPVSNGIQRNTNASLVMQAEKEKRERAKEESLRKKEKDKEDRERQKRTQEEKKEKRKTQKGERRR